MTDRPMTTDEPRKPVPTMVPPLLSFVAGYVDSITFLALFGFFAAHVTGSFVVAAAELVVSDRGVIVKMLAIPAFMLGAGVGAAIIIARRGRKDSSLPLVFALETILLAAFVVLLLQSWPVILPESFAGGAAGLLAATAMGVQSALVRLLLRDVPQTNVMSGNSTQLAIEAAEIIYARVRPARVAADVRLAERVAQSRKRFASVLSVLLGFLAGALGGALAYAAAGPWSACLAILAVAGMVAWSAKRGGTDPV